MDVDDKSDGAPEISTYLLEAPQALQLLPSTTASYASHVLQLFSAREFEQIWTPDHSSKRVNIAEFNLCSCRSSPGSAWLSSSEFTAFTPGLLLTQDQPVHLSAL